MGIGETTVTSRKRTGHVMLKLATNSLLKLPYQELSIKSRKPSERQWLKSVASTFTPAIFDTSNQPLKRQFQHLPLAGTPSFTPKDTNVAIHLPKLSMAIGLDGISALHFKKLAHGTINYLTNILNLTISTGQIHEIWHKAIIILIPSPGKGDNTGMIWRPVSLLCPSAKRLLDYLLSKILTLIHFHTAQRGCRPKYLTGTALLTITADIAVGVIGKIPSHQIVLVEIGLTAAFDNVDHQQLFDCVYNTNIPATFHPWICKYIQNRRVKVHYRQQESKCRN